MGVSVSFYNHPAIPILHFVLKSARQVRDESLFRFVRGTAGRFQNERGEQGYEQAKRD